MALADTLKSFFGIDVSAILDRIRTLLGPFGKLIDSIKTGYDKIVHILDAAEKLKESIIGEIDGWRNFKQDIRFAQRVIQIESAINKTRDLIEGIPAAWRSILDIIKQFKEKVSSGSSQEAIEEAEAIVTEGEASGIKALLEKFPRLARGLTRVLGVLAVLIDALESIASVIDDVQNVVDELRRLRLEIEKLDTIFLSQSNKRKTLRLTNGKTIRIRLGKLHQV
jgi:hypothetical protein